MTDLDVQENYKRIKREVEELIGKELALLNAKQDAEEAVQQSETPEKDEKSTQKNDQSMSM